MDKDAFLAAVLRNPVNEAVADELFRLALADAWLVSGCLAQLGLRRHQNGHDVYAPNGFSDIAHMIVRPNHGPNFSAASYIAKAMRWKALWPELTILAADSVDQNDVVN
jgi:hypothetical protein